MRCQRRQPENETDSADGNDRFNMYVYVYTCRAFVTPTVPQDYESVTYQMWRNKQSYLSCVLHPTHLNLSVGLLYLWQAEQVNPVIVES